MGQPTLSRVVRTLRASARRPRDPDDSDRDLLDRFLRAKDDEAFRALVARHGAVVLSACRQVLSDPADIDDAFQATFVVLLKKAKTLDAGTPLAGWLFAVAHRVAVRCRADARRRQTREAEAAKRSRRSAEPPDLSWREAAAVVHAEMNALPDKYRLPLLLCCVHGLTRDEAAEQLGITVGAVRGHLERGRSLLERRLTRRGVVLSAGLLAVLVGGSRAAGGPSAGLIDLTLRATGGTINPAVATLAHGAFPMSAVLKRMIPPVTVALGLIGTGLGLGAWYPSAAADEKPAAKAEKKEPPRAADPTKEVGGKVLGPDGKPVAAELILLRANGPAELLTRTGADGAFRVKVPPKEDACLVARADGYGADFRFANRYTPAEVTFKLPKDNPVRGRVLDTQGKPVAGAVVFPQRLDDYGARGADVFLNDWKIRDPQGGRLYGEHSLILTPRSGLTLPDGRTVLAAKTDADGKFELHGTGAERVVNLFARGPGIADTEIMVVNRAGFDPTSANQAAADNRERMVPPQIRSAIAVPQLHGPAVTLVAEQEKLIRGRVIDRDTGMPRPGVEVKFGRVSNFMLLHHPHTATTDRDGRFVIRGSRKYPAYIPEVPADPETGYLPAQAEVKDTAGYEPVEIEIETAKGIVVTGKLTDKESGKPLAGVVSLEPMQENPHLPKYPTMSRSPSGPQQVVTRDDGTFRLVTIPGPVLLMAGLRVAQQEVMYLPPQVDPMYPQFFRGQGAGPLMYMRAGGGYTTIRGCWCKVLDTPAGEKTVTRNIELEPAKRKAVRVVDHDGKPVAACDAAGIVPRDMYPIGQEGGTVYVYGLEPGRERQIVVCQQERKLVGSLVVKESDKDPVVTLGPAGVVTGRAVDGDGKPLAGASVHLHYSSREAEWVFGLLLFSGQATTDMNGDFRVGAAVPGHEFRIAFSKGSKNLGPKAEQAPRFRVEKPGETTAVGTVVVKPE